MLNARSAAAVLLFLLGIGLLFALFSPQRGSAAQTAEPEPEIGIADYGEAFFGGQRVAYLVSEFGGCTRNASVRAVFLQERPKRFAYLLLHPSINTADRNAVYEGARQELERSGYSLSAVGPDFLRTARDSIVICASGALPSYFVENPDDFASRGNVLLLVGDADYSIGINGTVQRINASAQNITPSSVVFIGGRGNEAAGRIARAVLLEEWQGGNRADGAERVGSLWTAKWPQGAMFARLAVKAECKDAALNRIFDVESSGVSGAIEGPATAQSGDALSFDARLDGIAGGDYGWAARKGGEVLARGFAGSAGGGALVGPFSMAPQEAGDYVISIEDSAGRGAARAVLHVYNLSASLLRNDGDSYSFLLQKDGEPLAAQTAEVGLEGSENTVSCAVWNGVCEIRARPGSENPEFVFFAGGGNARLAVHKAGAAIEGWQLAAAAAVVLAVALIGGKKAPVYTIVAEEAGQAGGHQIAMKKSGIVETFDDVNRFFGWERVPLRRGEVAFGLGKKLRRGGSHLNPSPESVDAALLRLEEQGALERHGEFFAPRVWKVRDIGRSAMERQISDMCLEAGAVFDRRRSEIRKDGAAMRVLVSPDVAQVRSALKKRQKLAAVFETHGNLLQFSQALSGRGGDGALILLAIENGKLEACTIEGLRGRI